MPDTARTPAVHLHRRGLLLGAAALAWPVLGRTAAATTDGVAPDGQQRGEVADLMPAFWRVYDRSLSLPAAQRMQRLMDGFFMPNEAIYRRAGIATFPAPESLQRWLAGFDAMAAEARRVHQAFVAGHAGQLQRFVDSFADFDVAASPTFLLPSLFSFDAHLEPDGQGLPLFFAPDGIVRHHGDNADLQVLFSHELFHCYQGQKNEVLYLDPQPPLYVGLWTEGVATFASEKLNPQASLLHVLLDDATLMRDAPAALPRMAAAALQKLDSTSEKDAAEFLSAGFQGDWPARAGYYLGLLAARGEADTLSLQEMAALPGPQVRERLAKRLQQMAAA